jgi:hypothetical protein
MAHRAAYLGSFDKTVLWAFIGICTGNSMFDWLTKKAARPSLTAQKELQKEERLKEAYKGQDTGNACFVRIDACVAARTAELKPKFIEVLKGRVELAKHEFERAVPPLRVARIEYKLFADNVDKAGQELANEVSEALKDWRNLFVQMHVPEIFDDALKAKIDDFVCELKVLGMEEMLTHAEALKEGDQKWRAQFPELDLERELAKMDSQDDGQHRRTQAQTQLKSCRLPDYRVC